jgi:riboflavin biosynthesis pyrimidine reductase
LVERGVEVWELGADAMGRVDLRELLTRLGERGISSVLAEGGAAVATALLQEGLVVRLVVVLAPKIVGQGLNAIGDLGILRMGEAQAFRFQQVRRRGDDLLIEARPAPVTAPDVPQPGYRPERN